MGGKTLNFLYVQQISCAACIKCVHFKSTLCLLLSNYSFVLLIICDKFRFLPATHYIWMHVGNYVCLYVLIGYSDSDILCTSKLLNV